MSEPIKIQDIITIRFIYSKTEWKQNSGTKPFREFLAEGWELYSVETMPLVTNNYISHTRYVTLIRR